ncbi:NUDIX hydrolase [Evansella cellulosilytica]|uniref:NUDIX hydrolase n=1 Tax=Evansella cellulosilytica (strain ATCC 21833 / DSM 2522 / FERM P-1141 / JCM 9156 / N-4) TaxID=649639 RepID=E6TVC5_EVAC2|nr:CoA pyrophosphatase [Evansella cellulosilytica]ADU29809.1 NUDIX hydrolase [Evansella cellulosilytica DSM 2522]
MDDRMIKYFRSRKSQLIDKQKLYEFALVVPLIVLDDEYYIVFEKRAKNITQPGEICFPGGKVDKLDESVEYAAVRELTEELGVPPHHIEVVGELDYLITPFNMILYPFLARIDSKTRFEKNDEEVAEILFIPLSDLMSMEPKEHYIYLDVRPEENFPYELIHQGENYPWRTGTFPEQFYVYKGQVIWGLTARILTHVLEEIAQAEKGRF